MLQASKSGCPAGQPPGGFWWPTLLLSARCSWASPSDRASTFAAICLPCSVALRLPCTAATPLACIAHRPLLHALVEPGIASAFGVEIDRIKCDKAAAFLRQTVAELARRSVTQQQLDVPAIECSPIEQVGLRGRKYRVIVAPFLSLTRSRVWRRGRPQVSCRSSSLGLHCPSCCPQTASFDPPAQAVA